MHPKILGSSFCHCCEVCNIHTKLLQRDHLSKYVLLSGYIRSQKGPSLKFCPSSKVCEWKLVESVHILGLSLMSLLWGMQNSYLIIWTKSYLTEVTLKLHSSQSGQKDTLLSRQKLTYLSISTKRYLLRETKSCIPDYKDKHIKATWLMLVVENKVMILI